VKLTGKPEGSTVVDLVNDPDLNAEIQKAVDEANKAVSNAEAIKKFAILTTDWTIDGGQLTPKQSIKRAVVMKEHAEEVEALYR
jgi:long-chain acyl-CoA synthetase